MANIHSPEVQPQELSSNLMGQSLLAGRLVATLEKESGHITISFKGWAKGQRSKRGIPFTEAERVYVNVPCAHGWPDKVGTYYPKSGKFYADDAADDERVRAAIHILNVAAGRVSDDQITKSTLCYLCGRELTDPESKERGMGPWCYGELTKSKHVAKNSPTLEGFVKAYDRRRDEDKIAFTEAKPLDVSTVKLDGAQLEIVIPKTARDIRNEMKSLVSARFDWDRLVWNVPATKGNLDVLAPFFVKHSFQVDAPVTEAIKREAAKAYGQIIVKDGRLEFYYEHDFSAKATATKDSIKSNGGQFDGKVKRWYLPLVTSSYTGIAAFLAANPEFVPTKDAAQRIADLAEKSRNESALQDELKEQSAATEKEIEIEVPAGLELYPYQKAGYDYVRKARRTFIADEMGVGKTVQALASIEAEGTFPAVVVVKNLTKLQWGNEAATWCPNRTVDVVFGTKEKDFDAEIIILNYEILEKHLDKLMEISPKALILDESQMVKNAKAGRTKAAKKLAKAIPADGLVLLLTGTPIVNAPYEYISQLDILGRLEEFGGWKGFIKNYIGWRQDPFAGCVVDKTNSLNPMKLNDELRKRCYVRRLKKDVLTELPEKGQKSLIPVQLSNHKEYAEACDNIALAINREVEREAEFDLDLMAMDDDQREIEIRNRKRERVTAAGGAPGITTLTTLRKLAGVGKIAPAVEWLKDFLEFSDEKIVVFAHHRDVQMELVKAFPTCAMVLGGQAQTPLKRQKEIKRFQEDENCRIVIASLEAAKEGVDGLQVANNMLFVEFSWTPVTHDQAEDRIHRKGQARGTNYYYMVGRDSLDDDLMELLDFKRMITSQATEGRLLPKQEIVKQLLRKITAS